MTKKLIVYALVCFSISFQAAAEPKESRLWRTNDGKLTVTAEAVDAKYDRKSKKTLIYLKKPDGKTFIVPYDSLTARCREFAWYDVQLRRAKEKERPFAFSPPGAVKFTAKRLSAVAVESVPDTLNRRGNDMLLGIAPRIHALGRPPEGWCGEVAIQEALLHYGIYYPQEKINEAGKPVHPDLYSNEIPVALKNLHVEYQFWDNNETDMSDFLDWLRKQTADGFPVLTAVKIYPTKHEDWSLDHFVLAVGSKDNSLVFNTTWGFRYTLAERQLRSTDEGFSFANKYNSYYGISIKGPRHHENGDRTVRLFVQQETADLLSVIVKCENLEPGKEYALYKSASPNEPNSKPLISFTAQDRVHAFQDTISRGSPSLYRCREISE